MKRVLLSVFCGVAAMMTGCKHHEGAYAPLNTTSHDLENHSPFVLLDARVQRSVSTSGVQETRLPDGRLQVSVNVRNREERRIQVQINCEFKDAQGFAMDSTPFNTLILREQEQKTETFVSANDKAMRYTVRVSEAH